MQNICANALMILCMCNFALAYPPPAGSFKVSSGRYKLPGGYRCGRGGVTYIRYPTRLDKGPFPIVSFGHGAGGGIVWDLLKSIASLGFVVLAPAKGICGEHWKDILFAMEWSRIQGNASLHKALGHVDWERRAILGHSFGGAHSMGAAAYAQEHKEHHVLAVVAAHGTSQASAPKLTLPLFIASEVTKRGKYASGPIHRRAFEAAVQANPRVLATAQGARHMEPMQGGRMNPYMAHFLGCHVAGLQSSCDRIYGKGPDSICRAQPMSVCEVIWNTDAPTPLPVGATHLPTSVPTLAPTSAPTTLVPTVAPTSAPSDAPTSVPTTLPPGATFSPTSSPTVAPTIEVKNRGKDCWNACGRKAGSCSYCGSGFCCRHNFASDPAECREAETFMNYNYHGCVGVRGAEPEPEPTTSAEPEPEPTPDNTTFSPTSSPTVTRVKNRGKDCWKACGRKAGSCSYCGSGFCCRQNFASDPAECLAAEAFMNENYHGCVGVRGAEPEPKPTTSAEPEPEPEPDNATISPTSSPTVAPTSSPTFAKELTPEDQPELKQFLELMSFSTFDPTPLPTTLPTFHPTNQPTPHPTSRPTLLPTRQPTLTCTDRSAQCSLWAEQYCNSERYGEFVRTMCRSSCDACITQDCADEYTACEVWKERGYCESPRFAPFLHTYCKKSCEGCDVHRRMSSRAVGNDHDTMEFPDFSMPDAPPEAEDEVADDTMSRGSVMTLVASSFIIV